MPVSKKECLKPPGIAGNVASILYDTLAHDDEFVYVDGVVSREQVLAYPERNEVHFRPFEVIAQAHGTTVPVYYGRTHNAQSDGDTYVGDCLLFVPEGRQVLKGHYKLKKHLMPPTLLADLLEQRVVNTSPKMQARMIDEYGFVGQQNYNMRETALNYTSILMTHSPVRCEPPVCGVFTDSSTPSTPQNPNTSSGNTGYSSTEECQMNDQTSTPQGGTTSEQAPPATPGPTAPQESELRQVRERVHVRVEAPGGSETQGSPATDGDTQATDDGDGGDAQRGTASRGADETLSSGGDRVSLYDSALRTRILERHTSIHAEWLEGAHPELLFFLADTAPEELTPSEAPPAPQAAATTDKHKRPKVGDTVWRSYKDRK